MAELNIGDQAPEFSLHRDGGEIISLSELKGAPIILYFYPKNDTSGCTKEAIAFSEEAERISELGGFVFGISKDSVSSHEKFRDKHALRVPLLSDPEGHTVQAYGVWVEKSMYGRKYMGIERATYLIDKEGKISNIWRKVKVTGHARSVMKALEEIA